MFDYLSVKTVKDNVGILVKTLRNRENLCLLDPFKDQGEQSLVLPGRQIVFIVLKGRCSTVVIKPQQADLLAKTM